MAESQEEAAATPVALSLLHDWVTVSSHAASAAGLFMMASTSTAGSARRPLIPHAGHLASGQSSATNQSLNRASSPDVAGRFAAGLISKAYWRDGRVDGNEGCSVGSSATYCAGQASSSKVNILLF
jgi:hypothetical protein